jgi:Phage integrase, N-terminal SAM-like domain
VTSFVTRNVPLSLRGRVDQAANAPARRHQRAALRRLAGAPVQRDGSDSKRRMHLTWVVPPGPKAGDEAEKVRTRLLHQVDQKRNPRTRATVGQLLDKWLQVLDVDPSTRRSYEGYIRKHIRPVLASLPLIRPMWRRWTLSTLSSAAAGSIATAGRTFSTGRARRTAATNTTMSRACRPTRPDATRAGGPANRTCAAASGTPPFGRSTGL